MLYQHLVSDHDCRKRVSQSHVFTDISAIMAMIHRTTCVQHTSKDEMHLKSANPRAVIRLAIIISSYQVLLIVLSRIIMQWE